MWQKMLQIGSGGTPTKQDKYLFDHGIGESWTTTDYRTASFPNIGTSNVANNRINLEASSNANYASLIGTANKIDTTGYTKIVIKLDITAQNSTGANLFISPDKVFDNNVKAVDLKSLGATVGTDLILETTIPEGEYYIGFHNYTTSYYYTKANIAQIYLTN